MLHFSNNKPMVILNNVACFDFFQTSHMGVNKRPLVLFVLVDILISL